MTLKTVLTLAMGTALAVVLLSATGCNTVRGVGKDIHDSAAAVQSWIDADKSGNTTIAKRP